MSSPLVPSEDVDDAHWYVDRLGRDGSRVGSVVPQGYAAYVRIPHAAEDGSPDDRTVREEGNLALPRLAALCDVLAGHTSSPDGCSLLVWVGYGQLPDEWEQRFPVVHQPGREYYLFRRRLDEVVAFAQEVEGLEPAGQASFATLTATGTGTELTGPGDAGPGTPLRGQSPSVWWPADRAWCVATEIDLDHTLVGGSADLVEALLRDPRLDCSPVGPDDDLSSLTEPVNPLPRTR